VQWMWTQQLSLVTPLTAAPVATATATATAAPVATATATATTAPAPAPAGTGTGIRFAVPSYIYPCNTAGCAWDLIIQAGPKAAITYARTCSFYGHCAYLADTCGAPAA
jgi:hypothetical protein